MVSSIAPRDSPEDNSRRRVTLERSSPVVRSVYRPLSDAPFAVGSPQPKYSQSASASDRGTGKKSVDTSRPPSALHTDSERIWGRRRSIAVATSCSCASRARDSRACRALLRWTRRIRARRPRRRRRRAGRPTERRPGAATRASARRLAWRVPRRQRGTATCRRPSWRRASLAVVSGVAARRICAIKTTSCVGDSGSGSEGRSGELSKSSPLRDVRAARRRCGSRFLRVTAAVARENSCLIIEPHRLCPACPAAFAAPARTYPQSCAQFLWISGRTSRS